MLTQRHREYLLTWIVDLGPACCCLQPPVEVDLGWKSGSCPKRPTLARSTHPVERLRAALNSPHSVTPWHYCSRLTHLLHTRSQFDQSKTTFATNCWVFQLKLTNKQKIWEIDKHFQRPVINLRRWLTEVSWTYLYFEGWPLSRRETKKGYKDLDLKIGRWEAFSGTSFLFAPNSESWSEAMKTTTF